MGHKLKGLDYFENLYIRFFFYANTCQNVRLGLRVSEFQLQNIKSFFESCKDGKEHLSLSIEEMLKDLSHLGDVDNYLSLTKSLGKFDVNIGMYLDLTKKLIGKDKESAKELEELFDNLAKYVYRKRKSSSIFGERLAA